MASHQPQKCIPSPARKNITLDLQWPTEPRKGNLKNVPLGNDAAGQSLAGTGHGESRVFAPPQEKQPSDALASYMPAIIPKTTP